MRLTPTVLVLASLASCVFACAPAEDDETGSRSDETRVKPGGSDKPGSLVVTTPSGAAAEATLVKSQSKEAAINEVLAPLSIGRISFVMTTNVPTFWLETHAEVTVQSDKTTTVAAGLLAVDAVKGPPTLGLRGFPSSTGLPIHAKVADARVSGQVRPSSDGSRFVPVLDGDYELNFGLNGVDGVPIRVGAGEQKSVSLTDMAARRVTRLKAPIRELPNATCGWSGEKEWLISLSNVATTQAVVVPDGAELDLGVSPRHEGAQYKLRHRVWSREVAIPLGERGAGPLPYNVGRIDVDHVSINGGPPSVTGRYEIFVADAAGARVGGNILTCTPETNSGVDVPPGHYRVEVHYSTVESGAKTDVHIVDAP